MQTVDCVIETPVSQSLRCKQLESLFDVPPQEKATLKWRGEIPIDEFDWDVGLIVGPSGSGKSTLARHLFGKRVDRELRWTGESVIDSFKKKFTVSEISKAFPRSGSIRSRPGCDLTGC